MYILTVNTKLNKFQQQSKKKKQGQKDCWFFLQPFQHERIQGYHKIMVPKYSDRIQFHAIVYTMLTPKWPFDLKKKNSRVLVLNMGKLHAKYEISSYLTWYIICLQARASHTHTHTKLTA